jgi:hypothetical protein
MKAIMLLILILSSCGKSREGKVYNVDPAFEPYMQTWIKEFGELRYGYIVVFADNLASEQWVGQCTSAFIRVIKIKRSWWNSVNIYARHQVFFHEMGHCELNQQHRDEEISFQDNFTRLGKKSIMNSTTLFSDEYAKNYSEYIKELKNPSYVPELYLLKDFEWTDLW